VNKILITEFATGERSEMGSRQEIFLAGPDEYRQAIATGLLQIGAVELRPNEPFIWSSGWKSPIYCDNRLILGYPILRSLVIDAYEKIIKQSYPSIDVIVGTATGGIAPAALLAERLDLPMVYVRSGAKGHGKQKQVEGKVVPGSRAIVIEDTLSTGKSSYHAIEAVQEEGLQVAAVFTVLSYDFDVAKERASKFGIPAYRLVDYQSLIDIAVREGYVSEKDVNLLLSWRESPELFGQES
jgi:orotate phosphoribosyltransferase